MSVSNIGGKDVAKDVQGPKLPPVRFASFLGDNAFEFYRQTVAHLSSVTGLSAKLVSGLSPAEQDVMICDGRIQVVFTCGLPYVRKADHEPPLLSLLAAPVLEAARYRNQPIYFSDVIVQANSPYRSLEDLRGTTFAYNEVYSLSGYMLPCYHLLARGQVRDFFDRIIQSGSHAISMDWVEAGQVDAAAIDSVVLEMELTQRPERAKSFRVVEHLGPAPMPPVAASRGLSSRHRQKLRRALLKMHANELGQEILKHSGVRRFAAVVDGDYDPIRQLIHALQQAGVTDLR